MQKLPIPMNHDLALLLIRIGLGAGFLAHGIMKLQGMEGTIGFFGSLGMPAFVAWLVAITETLGGAAMILGIYARHAGIALSLVMLGAIGLVKMKMFGKTGYVGTELEVMYLLASLAIVYAGPGKYVAMKEKAAAPTV